METCELCGYLVRPGDGFSECHRNPPRATENKTVASYPLVKDGCAGCGEWTDSQTPAANTPDASKDTGSRVDKVRSKALR
jgi:hypothetical protein